MSAMAKTVGTPTAIGAQMIIDGKLTKKGLLEPIIPEIYEHALKELEEKSNIKFDIFKVD